MKHESLHKFRDNANEIAYKKAFNDLEVCKKEKKQLQKDLDNDGKIHMKLKQYCDLAEEAGNVSLLDLDKDTNQF